MYVSCWHVPRFACPVAVLSGAQRRGTVSGTSSVRIGVIRARSVWRRCRLVHACRLATANGSCSYLCVIERVGRGPLLGAIECAGAYLAEGGCRSAAVGAERLLVRFGRDACVQNGKDWDPQ